MKFDWVTRFCETNSMEKFFFVIQDFENFQFPIEITVLPFFRKIEFFPGFTTIYRLINAKAIKIS